MDTTREKKIFEQIDPTRMVLSGGCFFFRARGAWGVGYQSCAEGFVLQLLTMAQDEIDDQELRLNRLLERYRASLAVVPWICIYLVYFWFEDIMLDTNILP